MSKQLELNYSWNGGCFSKLNSRGKFHYPISDTEMGTIEVDKNDINKFFVDLEESITYNNSIADLITYNNPNWVIESIKFVEWEK